MSSRKFLVFMPSAQICVPIPTADLTALLNALEGWGDGLHGACSPVDQGPPGIRIAILVKHINWVSTKPAAGRGGYPRWGYRPPWERFWHIDSGLDGGWTWSVPGG